MTRILMLYSTTDGHTLKICRRLQQVIQQSALKVTLAPIDEHDQLALDDFDKIVIGASIRYGHHHPDVLAFINAHEQLLDSRPNAFFSVSLVARKAQKNRPEKNPYFRKFLKQIHWRPKQSAVFAGRVNYSLYSFWDRHIIRLIMWITRGPTDPATDIEFTNWQEVDAFADVIARM